MLFNSTSLSTKEKEIVGVGLTINAEGVFRWHNRVAAYAFTLVTDQYPPFKPCP